jgi:hypothetical protein
MTDNHLRPLGRREPTDDKHLRRYPLTAGTMPTTPTPVCIGVNWYAAFDHPYDAKTGHVWTPGAVGTFTLPTAKQSWGNIRGGHEICLKPPALADTAGWYRFYNQGHEGACVGFALSRMMSLLNRERYDARRLYLEAQLVDDWSDTPPEEGTSGRAGCDVLRLRGAWQFKRGVSVGPDLADGITANRWGMSVEDIAACLSPSDEGLSILNAGYVTLLNSWGENGYPHYCRMPLDTLNRLVFSEGGDAVVVTDR